MKIATWNVNSVRKRTANLVSWLQRAKPDVVVLQELKAQEPQFPRLEVESAGYKVEIVGQKGFNGVALLSLHPVEITARTLRKLGEDGVKNIAFQPDELIGRFSALDMVNPETGEIYIEAGDELTADNLATALEAGFHDLEV